MADEAENRRELVAVIRRLVRETGITVDDARFLAMPRRKKRTYLTQPEIERFMNAATELDRACCAPIISSSCEHSRALTKLNAAIVTAIEAVTGDKAPWMQTPRAELHPGIKRGATDHPAE